MNKGIEWLKEEIGDLPCVDTVFNSDGSSYIDSAVPVMAVYDLINQLDEPEVLSEGWVDSHTDIVENNFTDEVYLGVRRNDLQNLLVPKQPFGNSEELPVIPQWVADNIESKKRVGTRLNVAMSEFPEFKLQKELDIDEHECNEIYARAWLDGYTVEEEQKYYVLGKRDTPVLFRDYRNRITETSNLSEVYPKADSEDFEFTEQEIKDYDERYWPFAVKVEELEE